MKNYYQKEQIFKNFLWILFIIVVCMFGFFIIDSVMYASFAITVNLLISYFLKAVAFTSIVLICVDFRTEYPLI